MTRARLTEVSPSTFAELHAVFAARGDQRAGTDDWRPTLDMRGVTLVAGPHRVPCEDCIHCPQCTARHRRQEELAGIEPTAALDIRAFVEAVIDGVLAATGQTTFAGPIDAGSRPWPHSDLDFAFTGGGGTMTVAEADKIGRQLAALVEHREAVIAHGVRMAPSFVLRSDVVVEHKGLSVRCSPSIRGGYWSCRLAVSVMFAEGAPRK